MDENNNLNQNNFNNSSTQNAPNFENVNFYNNPYYNTPSSKPYYSTSPQQNSYNSFNEANNQGYYNSYNQPPTAFPKAYQNNAQNFIASQQRFLKLNEQKRELNKFATIISLAMLGFLAASAIVGVALELFNLYDLYESNMTFSSSVGIFYTVFAVGLPFFLADRALKKHQFKKENTFTAPKLNAKTLLIILLSIFGCLAAMYVTNIITILFESFGLYFSSSDEPVIKSVTDIIAMFLGTAIIPPLVEEFAMRKVVMQPLRKYGNTFAIVTSAILFGIFHGTPSQIPFAFLSGLFLGYAVIATNSIWTGVVIHSVVNGLSCSYYAILYFTNGDTADMIYNVICFTLIGIGLLSLIIYCARNSSDFKMVTSQNGLSDFSTGEKFRKFIFSPLMVITIIIFLIQACSLITTESGIYT